MQITDPAKIKITQLTACTGQPNLADNITQAQAFCIATACLQVPVLLNRHQQPPYHGQKPSYELALAGVHDRIANKLSLLRPSTWFGARDANSNINKWNNLFHQPQSFSASHRHQAPWYLDTMMNHRYRRSIHEKRTPHVLVSRLDDGPLLTGATGQLTSLDTDMIDHNLPFVSSSLIAADDEPKKPSETPTTTLASTSPAITTIAAPESTTAATAVSTTMTTTTARSPSSDSEKAAAPRFTNFNKAYAQIYNSLAADRSRKPWELLTWKPPGQYNNVMADIDLRQKYQQVPKSILVAANRVASMMQSVSERIQPKSSGMWHLSKAAHVGCSMDKDLVSAAAREDRD